MSAPQAAIPVIYPCLRYRDAVAAIAWLQEAFGLEKGLVVDNPDGTIAHAELWLGPCCVMLGSVHKDADGNIPTPPADPGAWYSIYFAIEDVDAHHAKARAAGAEITAEPHTTDYSPRQYVAKDLEGFTWSFGAYRAER